MSQAGGSVPLVHFSLFALRSLTGLALIYYQGWEQFAHGWRYMWHGTHWRLFDHFNAGHVTPVAVGLALATAVFFFVSPLMLMVGFLTRLNALLIFLGLMLALDGDLNGVLSTSLHTQTLVLYFLITLFFGVNGGGAISVDQLFHQRRGHYRTAGKLYS